MASYLNIVNSVLRKLREPQVGSVAENAISLLVGSFVNDAKREVEDAWQWSHLQDTFSGSFTTVNSGVVRLSTVTLTNSAVAPTERAQIWQSINSDDYLVRLDTVGTEQLLSRLQFGNRDVFVSIKQNSNNGFKSIPASFYLTTNPAGVTAGTSTKVLNCYPPPDTTYPFTCVVKNPQADLSGDTDNMLIPTAPVVMRAYLYSLYERGEELGEALTITSNKADEALADAIADDTKTQGELQLLSE